MSEVQTNTAPESDRIKFNRRIREKRTKGHSSPMIAEYAANCPVPLDQLHDLTPQELAEARSLQVEAEKRLERRREDGEERDKDGRTVPANIDYEAVKDIPAKDDAHRTTLARLNQLLRLREKNRLEGIDQFVFGEVKRRATAYHEADPSRHFLEHCLRAWQETTRDEWKTLYEQHREEERKQAQAVKAQIDALKPETLAELFDGLAKYNVATVEIEFQDEGGLNLGGCVENVLNAEGEKIDLNDLPDEDGLLGIALLEACGDEETWEEYAREAIIGDTDERRYAEDGWYFKGVVGKVTLNILERTVSLDATAMVKVIEEREEEVVKTWIL